MPKSVRKMLRERQGKKPDEEEEDDDLEDIDRITKEEAYLFPIFGSITLLGLFLAFKYLDKVSLYALSFFYWYSELISALLQRIINLILSSYFAILGTAGLARVRRSVYSAMGEHIDRLLSPFYRWESMSIETASAKNAMRLSRSGVSSFQKEKKNTFSSISTTCIFCLAFYPYSLARTIYTPTTGSPRTSSPSHSPSTLYLSSSWIRFSRG